MHGVSAAGGPHPSTALTLLKDTVLVSVHVVSAHALLPPPAGTLHTLVVDTPAHKLQVDVLRIVRLAAGIDPGTATASAVQPGITQEALQIRSGARGGATSRSADAHFLARPAARWQTAEMNQW